jgi:hypothetical protein
LCEIKGVATLSPEAVGVVERLVKYGEKSVTAFMVALMTEEMRCLREEFCFLKKEVVDLRAIVESGKRDCPTGIGESNVVSDAVVSVASVVPVVPVASVAKAEDGLMECEKEEIRKFVSTVMFDSDAPVFCFKAVADIVFELLSGTVLRDADLLRRELVRKVVRHKVDGLHQLIGRWVRFLTNK